MERFFNIAEPCVAAKHYMLPATARLPEVGRMIRRGLYFVVHAPRQSGKTTALKQLVRDINGSGERVVMYCSLEALQNVEKIHKDDYTQPLGRGRARTPAAPLTRYISFRRT